MFSLPVLIKDMSDLLTYHLGDPDGEPDPLAEAVAAATHIPADARRDLGSLIRYLDAKFQLPEPADPEPDPTPAADVPAASAAGVNAPASPGSASSAGADSTGVA
jgi:hypothetical protein